MTLFRQNILRITGLIALLGLTAFPFVSSPLALFAGFSFTLLFGNPIPKLTARTSKILLQLSVVGLGFGVNFVEVIEVGKNSLLLTFFSISTTILLGYLIGQALQLSGNTRVLISFGTAICGGSAIAALAPVVKARDEEIAVSLATVFTLNAVALFIFPPLGEFFGLSQHQFGLWAALAIHDTSSVVGASEVFGATALAVGTIAKLTRALWIAPCVVAAGLYRQSKNSPTIPLFIIGFITAAFLNSWLPGFDSVWNEIHTVSKQLLILTLFLIGTGLTRQTLEQIGLKPLLLGVFLWFLVGSGTLVLLLQGHIG